MMMRRKMTRTRRGKKITKQCCIENSAQRQRVTHSDASRHDNDSIVWSSVVSVGLLWFEIYAVKIKMKIKYLSNGGERKYVCFELNYT